VEPDDDSIDVSYVAHHRTLHVECGHSKFRKIVEFLRDEAADGAIPAPDQVFDIVISDAGEHRGQQLSGGEGWKDRVALLGCALIVIAAIVAVFLMVVGVQAISSGFLDAKR
jgi:hypothetical protein